MRDANDANLSAADEDSNAAANTEAYEATNE